MSRRPSSINYKGFSFLILCDHYLMFTEDAPWTCFSVNTEVGSALSPFPKGKSSLLPFCLEA